MYVVRKNESEVRPSYPNWAPRSGSHKKCEQLHTLRSEPFDSQILLPTAHRRTGTHTMKSRNRLGAQVIVIGLALSIAAHSPANTSANRNDQPSDGVRGFGSVQTPQDDLNNKFIALSAARQAVDTKTSALKRATGKVKLCKSCVRSSQGGVDYAQKNLDNAHSDLERTTAQYFLDRANDDLQKTQAKLDDATNDLQSAQSDLTDAQNALDSAQKEYDAARQAAAAPASKPSQTDPSPAAPAVPSDSATLSMQKGVDAWKAGDFKAALGFYQTAADGGSAYAMFDLGAMYQNGQGDAVDLATAFQWYKKSSDAGAAIGTSQLGFCYLNGLGVDKNYFQAALLFQKSSDAGVAASTRSLGFMYDRGLGVPVDANEAFKLFLKAANAGDLYGMFDIGVYYENGKGGVGIDYSEAMKWYRKAADAQFPQAFRAVGFYFEKGWSVSKDNEEAKRWYTKAVAAGYKDAEADLKRLGG